MIPIRDHNPIRIFPFINYLLITANVIVFLLFLFLPQYLSDYFFIRLALIPEDIIGGQNILNIFTSMFLHASILHLGGNMLFLYIFGDNVEDKLGHLKYLLFYFLCGIGAALVQILVDPFSPIPSLGASGAISGVLGAYLILFPGNRIELLMPWLVSTIRVPAFAMIIYWVVLQFFFGIGSLGLTIGGVAYFAHLGGFTTGIILVLFLRKKLEQTGHAKNKESA